MRKTTSIANWLLNESFDNLNEESNKNEATSITFGEAFKKIKLNGFTKHSDESDANDSEETEFGINFYPPKSLIAKGKEEYPVVNVFFNPKKKFVTVDASYESTGENLAKINYTNLEDLVEKLSKLDVTTPWKKYCEKLGKKLSTSFLK